MERQETSELKKTRMTISGLRTEAYIQVKTGFKAQYESCTRVRTLIRLLLVMSNPRTGILGWRATSLVHDIIMTSLCREQ